MINGAKILEMQELVRRVPVPPVIGYAVDLVRPRAQRRRPWASSRTGWSGGGAAGAQYIILAAKARAILQGRYVASVEDVRAVAPILRHRILTNFNAQADGITSLQIVARLDDEVAP